MEENTVIAVSNLHQRKTQGDVPHHCPVWRCIGEKLEAGSRERQACHLERHLWGLQHGCDYWHIIWSEHRLSQQSTRPLCGEH
uniref:Alternative protein CYP3A5 n=1 Tax=Homo sapiens TaxID=9606 RepID=L8EC58_HUMAN|nr:alternative protein CYP3A5 [Homo sapiens]